MTERAADHVPLPHPDQIIDDQSVGDVGYQTATQFVRWEGRSLLCPSVPTPIRHPKPDVRVSDVRLPKHAAAAVARALGFGTRGGLQIVDETPHLAALHESRTA